MNLSKLAVKRPVTIMMMILIIVLLGTISLTRLPLDLFPEIEVPVAVVATSYSGAGPQEVENLVTKPMEGSVATVGNIDSISSISSEGSSLVIAEFNMGTDMDFAALEMREKVDTIKGFLPDDADSPMVLKIDPNSMPIIQISLSTEGDLAELQSLAEETFSQRLERLEGVASVSVGGGFTKEIEISVDTNSLSSYGLSINQLAQILNASNINLPGGQVENGESELSASVVGEFKTIDEIRNMPLTLPTGAVITLDDISSVELKNKEVSSISRTNGKDSINISLQKQSGSNTVQVANLINDELEALEVDYPDIEIDVVMDNSLIIKRSINTVVKNVIAGSIFAIIVLYIFLKNIRTTLIIATSIPISVIASFILLYFNGITLNMLTLGGLALAVGMLVDSAIVVLENIYRFRSEGYSKKESAIKGASEVGMAITASTLTTIAVFLPIVFVDGIVGIMFKDFALTVTLSLAASLLVSLTLIPMLSSKILRVESKEETVKKSKLGFLHKAFDSVIRKIEKVYKGILTKSIKHRKTTIFVAIVVFIVSMASLAGVGMEFIPATDEGTISIGIDMPLGTRINKMDSIAQTIEDKITDIPEIDVIFSNVSSSGDVMMGGSSGTSGSLTVGLVELSERDRSTGQVAEEIRNLAKDIPGAEISVNPTSTTEMMTAGSPISISIKGSELDTLEEISNDVKEIIESVEGTREVKTGLSEAVPELEVLINKEMAANYGLTTAQIASSVRGNASGTTVAQFKDEGEEIDIVIRPSGNITESLSNYEHMNITTPTGANIPLSQVADLSVVKGPLEITRENQEKVVTVTGQIVNRDLNSIVKDIDAKLQEYEMPEGYQYSIGGENEEMMEAFGQLALALVLAVILIYMVMASQFESLINPFIIMFTMPLAFSGGALGLFITGRKLGVTSFIGIIMLAGIVVNNGIVLIDYINTLRNEGKDRSEAIIIAGPVRLRPILMTTLTTILGLLPLAFGVGEGSELMSPMATVVIGGLLLSTVITLVFVPVIYTVFDDLSNSFKSKLKGKKKNTTLEA